MSLRTSSFINQMQTFISHSSCFSNVCERQSSFTTHPGNHAADDFKIAFDYMLGWDLLIWKLKGTVCFGSLIEFFVPIHQSTLYFSCICSVLSHTSPTTDILLFTHFYISLCEVLLIHTLCLLHECTYLIMFLYLFFVYEF